MSDLTDEIEENAGGPLSVSVDGGSAQQHSLRDQIEADRYLAVKRAQAAGSFGIRLVKMFQPGTV